jgi:hypothetical protein
VPSTSNQVLAGEVALFVRVICSVAHAVFNLWSVCHKMHRLDLKKCHKELKSLEQAAPLSSK